MPDSLELFFSILFTVVGGLGIFLLGMKFMSEGVQAVAGNTLRRMISAVTDNRILATGVGTAITCMVQSSSVTTVLVVGMVNAGFMALHQAVGVIMGANIGTTITGWILVLKVGKYGLPILGLAALVYLFARNDRRRFIAMAVMGIGMVFFGLELMKDGFGPLKDIPLFSEAFAYFHANTYFGVLMCAMVGCLLTCIVQSSSATLAITISLTATGVIPFPTAAALVLGENLGTTITAWLASLGANTSAKRAAYAHILFNLVGVLWITAVFRWYILLIAAVVRYVHGTEIMTASLADFESPVAFGALMTAGIASVHTGFNVTNTLLFLPFVRKFTRLLEWMMPEKGKEVPHLRHLDLRVVDTPALGIETSRSEVIKMGRGVLKMMDWTKQAVLNDRVETELVKKTFRREVILDNVEREVLAFMTGVLDGNVPYAVAEEGRQQLRIAHEYESISDAIASILKGRLRLRKEKLDLLPQQKMDLNELHDSVADYLRMVVEAFEQNRPDVLTRATSMSVEITRRTKEFRDRLLGWVTETNIDPRLSLAYTSLLTNYRRVKEHALNVAEAMAGAKSQPVLGG